MYLGSQSMVIVAVQKQRIFALAFSFSCFECGTAITLECHSDLGLCFFFFGTGPISNSTVFGGVFF